jgi:hypothetical protein
MVAWFHEDVEGTIWFKERLVVAKREALKKKIRDEAHTTSTPFIPRAILVFTNEA